MPSNLYDLLGVARDAGLDAIRKAYKKAVLKAHPDVGGARKDFDMVQTALRVLSDPKARDHYDRTGKWEEPEADNDEARRRDMLAMMLDAILAEHPDADLAFLPMAKGLRNVCKEVRAQLAEAMAKEAKQIERWARMRNRWIGREPASPGPRILARLVEAKVDIGTRAIAEYGRKLQDLDAIEVLLREVDYRQDAPLVAPMPAGDPPEWMKRIWEAEQLADSLRAQK